MCCESMENKLDHVLGVNNISFAEVFTYTKRKARRLKIKDMELYNRTINILTQIGFNEIGELEGYPYDRLRKYKGIGRKTITDVNDMLENWGLVQLT